MQEPQDAAPVVRWDTYINVAVGLPLLIAGMVDKSSSISPKPYEWYSDALNRDIASGDPNRNESDSKLWALPVGGWEMGSNPNSTILRLDRFVFDDDDATKIIKTLNEQFLKSGAAPAYLADNGDFSSGKKPDDHIYLIISDSTVKLLMEELARRSPNISTENPINEIGDFTPSTPSTPTPVNQLTRV